MAYVGQFPPGRLWAPKLDLTNFFWSLRIPECAMGLFSVNRARFDCLPFGWNASPFIAQTVLVQVVQKCLEPFGGQVGSQDHFGVWVYLDDILVLADDQKLCAALAVGLKVGLEEAGLIFSPKSLVVPSKKIEWLGREFSLEDRSVGPTKTSILKLMALVVATFLSR
jgi:hypothetical protein